MMRSSEEQLNMILRRANRLRRSAENRARAGWSGAAACLCVLLLVGAWACLPALERSAELSGGGRYGSLVLTAAGMGYAVIGVLSFALGVCVSLACIYWSRARKKEDP